MNLLKNRVRIKKYMKLWVDEKVLTQSATKETKEVYRKLTEEHKIATNKLITEHQDITEQMAAEHEAMM